MQCISDSVSTNNVVCHMPIMTTTSSSRAPLQLQCLVAVALLAIPLAAQGISSSAQVVQALTSNSFNSCSQTSSQSSIPIGPLPMPAVLPGLSWTQGPSSITVAASGTATICNFSSPAGSFSRSGEVEVVLTSAFETTCAVNISGNYSTTGGYATTTVSGAVQATLGGFFSPIPSVNQTSTIRVGPAGTTIKITLGCSGNAGFGGYATVQSNLTVSWIPVNAAGTAPYGTGCMIGGTTQTATSVPQLGGSIDGAVAGAAGPMPLGIVAIGFSDLVSSAGALPFSLDSLGMTGCQLLQSSEVVLNAIGASASTLTFQVPLPSSPTLAGVNLFTQVFSYAPGLNPLGVNASGGLRWQLGT